MGAAIPPRLGIVVHRVDYHKRVASLACRRSLRHQMPWLNLDTRAGKPKCICTCSVWWYDQNACSSLPFLLANRCIFVIPSNDTLVRAGNANFSHQERGSRNIMGCGFAGNTRRSYFGPPFSIMSSWKFCAYFDCHFLKTVSKAPCFQYTLWSVVSIHISTLFNQRLQGVLKEKHGRRSMLV